MSDNINIVNKKKRKVSLMVADENDQQPFVSWASFNWGMLAAFFMLLFEQVIQLSMGQNSIVLMIAKYLILAGLMFVALKGQKRSIGDSYRFKDGLKMGASITFVTAIAMAVFNLLLSVFTSDFGIAKFSFTADSTGDALVLSGVLIFEALVFGLVLTFISLQWLKPKRTNIN